jgi:Bacterial aa3 type cytochrome c oxidase subunit IV
VAARAAERCSKETIAKLIERNRVMAAHGAPEYSVADGNDYAAHEQTYLNFISLVKWIGGFVVLIVIGMAYFLT